MSHRHTYVSTVAGPRFAYCIGCDSYFELVVEYRDGRRFATVWEVYPPWR
jgi:hypothetical protein